MPGVSGSGVLRDPADAPKEETATVGCCWKVTSICSALLALLATIGLVAVCVVLFIVADPFNTIVLVGNGTDLA